MIANAIRWLFEKLRDLVTGFADWLLGILFAILNGIWQHWLWPLIEFWYEFIRSMFGWPIQWLGWAIPALFEWGLQWGTDALAEWGIQLDVAAFSVALHNLASVYAGVAWILPVQTIMGIIAATIMFVITVRFVRWLGKKIPLVGRLF